MDEVTGVSASPDPKFERELQVKLEIVKEAGEMGEFLSKWFFLINASLFIKYQIEI